jgi:hypothetical protein
VIFLNLCVIQSPQGIIIDQTDHIVDTIIDTYFSNRDLSNLVPITNHFPTDSQFESDIYYSPFLPDPGLKAIWRISFSLERHFASCHHHHMSGFRI